MVSRVIRKSQSASAAEAADLLVGIFSCELVAPSRCLWLVSPWISDVELIDNSAGGFDALTRFGKRRIRLVEALVALASMGTHIVVGTTTDGHNDRFLRRLQTTAEDLRVRKRLTISIDPSENLHAKSVTGNDFTIDGSMNITYNGIHVREELIDLRTDMAFVEEARMDAYDRFGGVL